MLGALDLVADLSARDFVAGPLEFADAHVGQLAGVVADEGFGEDFVFAGVAVELGDALGVAVVDVERAGGSGPGVLGIAFVGLALPAGDVGDGLAALADGGADAVGAGIAAARILINQ